MKIKTVNAPPENACRCGSWLGHWTRFSGQQTSYCAADKCLRRDLVGAHVQKAGSADANRYILPLCPRHAQAVGELDVPNHYVLVSANRKETCEKG